MCQGIVQIHFADSFGIAVEVAQIRPKTAPQRDIVHTVDFIAEVEMESAPEVVAFGIGGVFLETHGVAAFQSGLENGDVRHVPVAVHRIGEVAVQVDGEFFVAPNV